MTDSSQASKPRWSRPSAPAARGFTLIELIIVLALIALVIFWLGPKLFSKSTPPGTGTENVVVGSFSPAYVPVTISIDSKGKLQVTASGMWVTPVGVFSAEWERRKVFYLEITLGNQTRFYPLGESEFRIDLPNTLKGQSRVTYDGAGNVRIIVPDPGNVGFP